jgi:anaerobic selenocysteine-containing dehydrogenase
MMKPVLAVALLAGMALASPVLAQALAPAQETERYTPISGATLMRLCTGRDAARVRECEAYIAGVSDSVTSYQAARPENGSKGQPLPSYICVPGRLTGPQLRDAVADWARQNSNELQRQASVVVIRALLEKFPCQRR